MNNDRVKLKRLEPSLKKIVKWRREVQEKLETEKIGLSPAEILNTEKWYEGLKTAEKCHLLSGVDLSTKVNGSSCIRRT